MADPQSSMRVFMEGPDVIGALLGAEDVTACHTLGRTTEESLGSADPEIFRVALLNGPNLNHAIGFTR